MTATIREDLGSPPEALFAAFDPAPIASASLAQVRPLGAVACRGQAGPGRCTWQDAAVGSARLCPKLHVSRLQAP